MSRVEEPKAERGVPTPNATPRRTYIIALSSSHSQAYLMFRPAAPTRRLARTRAVLTATFAAAGSAVLAAGCRDVTAPEQDPATVVYASKLGIRLSDYTKDTSGVYYRDLAVGSGPKAVLKSSISCYYTGYLADGRTFSTNVGSSSLYNFVLGAGQNVPGFDRGLLGINQGGRRRIIIPPALGYGNKSYNNAIPAGSVLIFVIDVPVVTPPAAVTTSKLR